MNFPLTLRCEFLRASKGQSTFELSFEALLCSASQDEELAR